MTKTFSELGLSSERVAHLESLGFHTPTPIQVAAIPALLAGRDLLGQAQTGTGKTATFALPLLEQLLPETKGVQALVLTPTRELAGQVCEAMRQLGGPNRPGITAVYGGQSIDRQVSQLRRGDPVVVGTPGRVLDLLQRGDLDLSGLRHLVLDEADEMLSLGFRDSLEAILQCMPKQRQSAFFSATLPPVIKTLAERFLHDPLHVRVESSGRSPAQIRQEAYRVPRGWTKPQALRALLAAEDPQTAIIFVRTRRTAAELTAELQAAGCAVDEYHGDLAQNQRERLMERFRKGRLRWVVATDIAARGLHIDSLSHVINFDLPINAETYLHRIGRTGRAGQDGAALTLVTAWEQPQLRRIERQLDHAFALQALPAPQDVELRRRQRLGDTLRAAMTEERVAAFLPLVAELERESDMHVLLAAALQLLAERQAGPDLLGDLPPLHDSAAAFTSRPQRSGGRPSRSGAVGKPIRRTVERRA
jgi:ATP-dependent RNA helicase DeaD